MTVILPLLFPTAFGQRNIIEIAIDVNAATAAALLATATTAAAASIAFTTAVAAVVVVVVIVVFAIIVIIVVAVVMVVAIVDGSIYKTHLFERGERMLGLARLMSFAFCSRW